MEMCSVPIQQHRGDIAIMAAIVTGFVLFQMCIGFRKLSNIAPWLTARRLLFGCDRHTVPNHASCQKSAHICWNRDFDSGCMCN